MILRRMMSATASNQHSIVTVITKDFILNKFATRNQDR